MNDFYLANACSINLNFLIYIKNLYENYNTLSETHNKFPWLPLDQEAFLNDSDIKIKIKELWSIIFNCDNLNENDINYWITNEFQFLDLFQANLIGVESYKKVKKSFECWYWGVGVKMFDIFSDCLVEDYYNKLISTVKLKDLQLKDIKFYLQVIYDTLPKEWELKNKNMIIISPQTELPTIEDIISIIKYV